MTLFRGATTVRNAVQGYIDTALPDTLTLARSQWGLDEYTLPAPAVLHKYERGKVSEYPCIEISVSDATDFVVRGLSDIAEEQYESRYTVLMVTFVRTPQMEDGSWGDPEYDTCLQLRDDMAAVVRAILLGNLALGQPDAMTINASTLHEQYSDAVKPNDSGRYVAAVSHQFTLQVDESLVRDPLGTADTIDVTPDIVASSEAFS